MIVKINGKPYETEMVNGVQRFKVNSCIKHLVDTKQIDVNKLCIDYQNGKFSQQDYAEVMMGVGYSVSAFIYLSTFEDMEIENPLWDEEN